MNDKFKHLKEKIENSKFMNFKTEEFLKKIYNSKLFSPLRNSRLMKKLSSVKIDTKTRKRIIAIFFILLILSFAIA